MAEIDKRPEKSESPPPTRHDSPLGAVTPADYREALRALKAADQVKEAVDTDWHQNTDGSGSEICKNEKGKIEAIKYPNGDEAAFDYDKEGNLVGYRRRNHDGSEVVMEKYTEYDENGEPKGPPTWRVKQTDKEGNVVSSAKLPPDADVSIYDVYPAGRLKVHVHHDGRDSYTIYETKGTVTRIDEIPGSNQS